MLSSMRKSTIIPPYWVDYLIGLFFLSLGVALSYWAYIDNLKQRPIFNSYFIIGVSLLINIKTCVHYSLDEKGIVVRFLWLPIRRVNWDMVSHAEYIYKWCTASGSGSIHGQGIFVTLKGCPMYAPVLDHPGLFVLKHPLTSFFIRFTSSKQKYYVEVFGQYYPDLDFQIGSETNLPRGR